MSVGVLILAGGLGKRMNSDVPKVLHKINDKTLIQCVIETANKLNPNKIGIIVGKYKDQIEKSINETLDKEVLSKLEYIIQDSPTGPLGTGHAVQCATEFIKNYDKILILSGDVPLITVETLTKLINSDSKCVLLVNELEEPTGYGRIKRSNVSNISNESTEKVKIVEEKECTEEEKTIKEINSGIYCFESKSLIEYLPQLKCNNAQNEYYLTDIVTFYENVNVIKSENNNEIYGVNTIVQLRELQELQKIKDVEQVESITNKKILIIGGTGSLGNKLTERYINNNSLYLYSRDESKHWSMGIDFKQHENLNFIIGNINDQNKIRQTLIRHNFDIIILAAALKHIDKCEFESNECMNTNLLGTQVVLNEIENNMQLLTNLEKVCFVSTDKACSPINIYGMCKAVSESLMVEKAKYINNIKFVCVRYGNVLNSRGSIIPMLHKLGNNKDTLNYKLTDDRMTRFVMTLEQSVDLIEHALLYAESGDIVIPQLISCRIIDLIEIFSEIYNKPIIKDKLRPGEKMLESLINETQSMRLLFGPNGYMYIKPVYKNIMVNNNVKDYNSTINPFNKIELKNYLKNLNLL